MIFFLFDARPKSNVRNLTDTTSELAYRYLRSQENRAGFKLDVTLKQSEQRRMKGLLICFSVHRSFLQSLDLRHPWLRQGSRPLPRSRRRRGPRFTRAAKPALGNTPQRRLHCSAASKRERLFCRARLRKARLGGAHPRDWAGGTKKPRETTWFHRVFVSRSDRI